MRAGKGRIALLELFSGQGAITKAVVARGCKAVSHDLPQGDLALGSVQRRIIRAVRAGEYRHVHLAPPCSSFSVAYYGRFRTNGCTRSADRPEGDGSVAREVLGNKLAHFSARVIDACWASNTTFSLENLLTSMIWRIPALAIRIAREEVRRVRLDFCAFGAPF